MRSEEEDVTKFLNPVILGARSATRNPFPGCKIVWIPDKSFGLSGMTLLSISFHSPHSSPAFQNTQPFLSEKYFTEILGYEKIPLKTL